MENKINVRLNKRLIKIIGGGVVGMEIAYICAKNGYRVHLFNKVQDEQTYILKESPFDTMMKEELELLGSPTYPVHILLVFVQSAVVTVLLAVAQIDDL